MDATTPETAPNNDFGPWNPGIQSQLPPELKHFTTLLRPENIQQSMADVEELSAFTGLGIEEIATFTPQRLVTHELLIRVAANYSISDGNQYEDLGNNFRKIAGTLLNNHLTGHMNSLVEAYAETRKSIAQEVSVAINALDKPVIRRPPESKTWWQKLTGSGNKPAPRPVQSDNHEDKVINDWQSVSRDENLDQRSRTIHASLSRVCGAIAVKHGRVIGDRELLCKIVTNHVCNHYGSKVIGDLIAPLIVKGAEIEGFPALPVQDHPVIINVKGSSAAGKSTLRPLQQKLTARLGLRWVDFALISPDIFRKFLLDYDSLGEHYKYAGTCSGQELQIVDQKLDAYMAKKALDHKVPHLLIDRFRFDSFAAKSTKEGSNLLTRFGSKVFMTFVITPPHNTVERAWKRGLRVGRFKASDDLIDHNIEAFNGMPRIFFTWALNRDKDVFHEFLDNSVALGERPRTVAFGRNDAINILDVEKLMDINRYQKLNVNAHNPQQVYSAPPEQQYDIKFQFLLDCLKRLKTVHFCDSKSGEIYARCSDHNRIEINQDLLEKTLPNEQCRTALRKLLYKIDKDAASSISEPQRIDLDYDATLGRWGQQEDD